MASTKVKVVRVYGGIQPPKKEVEIRADYKNEKVTLRVDAAAVERLGKLPPRFNQTDIGIWEWRGHPIDGWLNACRLKNVGYRLSEATMERWSQEWEEMDRAMMGAAQAEEDFT